MRRESGSRFLVELGERSGISAGMICCPGGERVTQLLLDGIRRNKVCRDGPRVGLLVDARVVCNDVGFADDPCRLAGDQLGISRAQADSVEAAGCHSASEASALIADDVIADPPRRPRTVTNGTSMPCARDNEARAALDSAAPTNPTGQPTMAAGRGTPPIRISKRGNRAVGALPMATTAPSSNGSHNEIAAAVRVVFHCLANSGTPGSFRKQCTSLAAGSRPAVMPVATMPVSHRIGAPDCSAVRAADISTG